MYPDNAMKLKLWMFCLILKNKLDWTVKCVPLSRPSVHGRFLFSFGIDHFIQILVDDVVELSLQPKKRIFSSREMIKISQINPFNSRRIHECPERSPWSRRRWPRPCHGPGSGSPSGGRGSFVRLTGYFWNLSHLFWTSWWFLHKDSPRVFLWKLWRPRLHVRWSIWTVGTGNAA